MSQIAGTRNRCSNVGSGLCPSEQSGVELILASDLSDDEPEYRFTEDPRLRTSESAKLFAITIRRESHMLNLYKSSVFRLRSRDAGRFSPERLRAVDTFWDTLTDAERYKSNCRHYRESTHSYPSGVLAKHTRFFASI